MASAVPAADAFTAPESDDELVRQYLSYVTGLVRKLGIPAQDVDDVAQHIMIAELQAGVRVMYNPQYTVKHGGQVKRVSFRSFLSHRVSLRVRGQRDAINRRNRREPLLCDNPVDESGTTWVELFGGSAHWDSYPDLDTAEFISRMRDYLATVPRISAEDSCDLVALFDELVRQVHETGEVTAEGVQERFGVPDVVADAWLARLRQTMAGVGDTELPRPEPCVIGGVTLSLADIRSAIEILRSSKGIMVRQPLDRAGHPLAKCAPPDWYHEFSLAERRQFPELEMDPQTHKKPAGHVKLAVIHRLERMLGIGMADAPPEVTAPGGGVAQLVERPSPLWDPSAGESPVPAAPSEPSPRELLEARLWRLGATPEDVMDILVLVDQCSPQLIPA